jgi:hypothetical protein
MYQQKEELQSALRKKETINKKMDNTSWLRCHKFRSRLYIDFFETGTGTLCFFAYSIASSRPVMSHSLQGATTLSSGFKA